MVEVERGSNFGHSLKVKPGGWVAGLNVEE